MKWKGGILIALVFFGAGLIVGYSISGQIVIGNINLPQNIFSILIACIFTFLLGLFRGSDFVAFFTNLYKEHTKTRKEEHDKKRIYDWLCGKTKHLKPHTVGSPFDTISWPSTEEISSTIDLTEERVKYICTIDNRIQRQEENDLWPNQVLEEERWAVRKFVRY